MCKFCKQYELMQEISERFEYPRMFSVALIDHMKFEGKLKNWTTHYMKGGIGFPLRFCPECGKQIDKSN